MAAAVRALNPEAIPGEGSGSGARTLAARAASSAVARVRESRGLSGALLKAGEAASRGTEPSQPAFRWDRRGLEAPSGEIRCRALPREEIEGRGTSPLQMMARR